MREPLSRGLNMDTACTESKFAGGAMISIDRTAVEDTAVRNMCQRSEPDRLICSNPQEYAHLALGAA